MTWVNPLQRTPEWINSRRGKITASRVGRVINGTARGWASFAAELAHEASDDYVHQELYVPSVENGRIYEPVAIANAELELGEEFEPVGFVLHPEFDYIGCSSDFLARDRTVNGEVKCPTDIQKHMAVKLNHVLPKEYLPQVQLQMAVHDLYKTIFISYYSGPKPLPYQMRIGIIEVFRDNRYIREMLERCHEFQRYRTGQATVTRRNTSKLPDLF